MTNTWWSYSVDGAVIVGSLATAVAVVVAALTYRRSEKLHRQEQASRVFALPISCRVSDAGNGTQRWDPFEATITNRSEMPVRRVAIALYESTGQRVAGRVVGMLMPDAESNPIHFPASFAATEGADVPAGEIPLLQIAFTDTNGIRWLRRPDGNLEEVDGETGA